MGGARSAITLASMQTWHRFTAIATGVAALHGAALWAVHNYRAPTQWLAKTDTLQTRTVEPPKLLEPAPLAATSPNPQRVSELPAVKAKPTAAAPAALAKPTPAPSGTPPAATSAAPLPATSPAPVQAAPTDNAAASAAGAAAPPATASPAPATTQLPSSLADHADTQYRHPLPAISTRLGEQGRVLVRVQVGTDGKALQVQLLKSSGFVRLDENALATVARWRFKPGTLGGVPEAMWVEQPVNYAAP